jgi:[pyruvate, water dikinase]-phosphate phosphotransferase / [pyruvate, water dikinase] kinase
VFAPGPGGRDPGEYKIRPYIIMPESKLTIYAVSDATGELAISVATAALRQFRQENVAVLRRARIRTLDRVSKVVREAKETGGVIIFTLVSPELRDGLLELARESQVPAVDVMGPVMGSLASYFNAAPSDQPGLKYQITGDYFRRNDAIEFAVKHDDGQGLETIDQADIVLLGISRTSKTPLSIYLAYRGVKTANIPIVRDVSPPRPLKSIDRRKLVGLTVSPDKLSELRGTRLAKLGLPRTENYANIDFIREELSFAHQVFLDLGGIPVIDVTLKAIEEVATEVLTVLGI